MQAAASSRGSTERADIVAIDAQVDVLLAAQDDSARLQQSPASRERSQTDDVNKSLLMSFLHRINVGSPDVPQFQLPADAVDAANSMEEPPVRLHPVAAAPSQVSASAAPPIATAATASSLAAAAASAEMPSDLALEFRLVEGRTSVRASKYATSSYPRDVVDIAANQDYVAMMDLFTRGRLAQQSAVEELEESGDEGEGETASAAPAPAPAPSTSTRAGVSLRAGAASQGHDDTDALGRAAARRARDLAATVDRLSDAIRKCPDMARLYADRSEAHLTAGNIAAADDDAVRCLELKPAWHRSHSTMAKVRQVCASLKNNFHVAVYLSPS